MTSERNITYEIDRNELVSNIYFHSENFDPNPHFLNTSKRNKKNVMYFHAENFVRSFASKSGKWWWILCLGGNFFGHASTQGRMEAKGTNFLMDNYTNHFDERRVAKERGEWVLNPFFHFFLHSSFIVFSKFSPFFSFFLGATLSAWVRWSWVTFLQPCLLLISRLPIFPFCSL